MQKGRKYLKLASGLRNLAKHVGDGGGMILENSPSPQRLPIVVPPSANRSERGFQGYNKLVAKR